MKKVFLLIALCLINFVSKGQSPTAIYFTDQNTGWAVGEYFEGDAIILKTTNGGINWAAQTSGIDVYLSSVNFTDQNTGWIVGEAGSILKTTNSGNNWTFQTSGVNNYLTSIHFADQNYGWAVGDSGTILKTINGGTNWASQTSGTNALLESVYFVDQNTGWTIGYNGKILKTTNGGENWTSQTSGTEDYLFSVQFIDQNNGWVVGGGWGIEGEESIILRTTNGGKNWTTQTTETSGQLASVHFIDWNNGWAVGGYFEGDGIILKTTNGGTNWATQKSVKDYHLNSVYFIDQNIGWAVGSGSHGLTIGSTILLKTTDGGNSWSSQTNIVPEVTSIPSAGLQLWLKSDAGVILNDSTVSVWADQSSNSNNAIQSNTDRQPLFVNNELNGKPVLRFDGDDDRLGLKGTDSTSQITLFLIEKLDSGKRGYSPFYIPIILGNSYGPGKQYGVAMRDISSENSSNTIFPFSSGNSLYATVTNCSAYNQWKVINITSNHYLENTSLRINGIDAVISDNGNLSIPLFFSLGDSTGTGLGCIGGVGTSSFPESEPIRFKGEIAEVILYNRVLSESERLTVENYLADKYGISNPTGVEDFQENKISELFALNQNYPNPFNPSTTISFSIPNSEFIALKVFDVLGREVTTLVNEEKPAGNYEVNFIASQLSSGIYFYKIQAGSFVETKKMILLK